MDVEEKNFSGRKWTDSGRDSGERKSSRVLQNATKGRPRQKREKRREEYESGQELLRQRVYEVPVDRMPSKRGGGEPGEGTSLFSLSEKSVILPCVT
ncbi:unnamed protein product [Lasius platythorax]|uniref:Uncharacterized protein n=1 Tax=Lasius platythorax TaxID=488582 RepID=A0AAV2NV88_9HYME